jgi:hypothetical protein
MKLSVLAASSLATLLLLSSCVRPQTKDDKAPPPGSPDSAQEVFRGPPHSGSEELTAITRDPETGCELRGQFDGELRGTALGEGKHFDQAAAQCFQAGNACVGVTSQWYVAFPWVAVGASDPFQADEMSYARTFLRWCPESGDTDKE